KPRTARSGRQSRSSPARSSSSADARKAKAPSRSSSRAARPPRALTSPPPATTTSRSDGAARPARRTAAQARAVSRRADPQAQLLLLPREDRRVRLQELAPAAPVRLREGQDPLAAHHRGLPAAPAPGRPGREARARDGTPSLRHGLMQVILRQDVEKIGLRGEVVDVAAGFARNYLLPRKLAETATPGKAAALRKHEDKRARHEAQSFQQAQERPPQEEIDAIAAAEAQAEAEAAARAEAEHAEAEAEIAELTAEEEPEAEAEEEQPAEEPAQPPPEQ